MWSELADAMHRAVQKVTLANGDIKVALNEAAAEVDRATAELKKGAPTTTSSVTLDRPRAGAHLGYRVRLQLWGVAFVLPALLFFVFFKYGPMGWAFWLSFTSYDMLAPPRFVGVANFAGLAGDPSFFSRSRTPWSTSSPRRRSSRWSPCC